jgi:hypothetical protein
VVIKLPFLFGLWLNKLNYVRQYKWHPFKDIQGKGTAKEKKNSQHLDSGPTDAEECVSLLQRSYWAAA